MSICLADTQDQPITSVCLNCGNVLDKLVHPIRKAKHSTQAQSFGLVLEELKKKQVMGTLIGHVAPGIGFVLVGLWHLLNTIRNYTRSPWDFETRPWFPTRAKGKLKYAELYLIIFSSCLSIAAELFICPETHQPFADDWSIPSQHLNNFEHSSMSMFFLIYASIALFTAVFKVDLPNGLLHLLAAFAFSQEWLLFHFHSADHMGLEGQYHWLLQLAIAACFLCTVLEIATPHSFLVALVRSMGIFLQGWWFIQMGLVLWIPRFVPIGCRMNDEDGHQVVRCEDKESSMRAKALANLQFNWYLAGVLVFTVALYLFILKRAEQHSQYSPLSNDVAKDGASLDSKHSRSSSGSHSSIEMEGFPAVDLER